jgi:hypothetical protein
MNLRVIVDYLDNGTLLITRGGVQYPAMSCQCSIDPTVGRVLNIEHILDEPEIDIGSPAPGEPSQARYLDGRS